MKYIALGDTVYFQFDVNDNTGTGVSATSPEFLVRQSGATAGAAPILTGTPVELINRAYPPGCYELAIPATSGNGFIDQQEYAVFVTFTVSGVNPTLYVGSFKTGAVRADVELVLGSAPDLLSAVPAVLTPAGLDAVLIESGITSSPSTVTDTGVQLTEINARQTLAAVLSALGGVLTGAVASPVQTSPAGKPTSPVRLSVAFDENNDRTAVTLRVPD